MKTQHLKKQGIKRKAMLTLTLATAFALVGCSTGGGGGDVAPEDEKPVFKDGQLQPLSDGFPSSPLSFVVVDEPGSDDGMYARSLAEAAKDISPVDIRVLDRPEFGATYGAWEALDWMADQRGGDQGYLSAVVTLPGSTIDLLSTPVAEDLGVSMESMNTVLLTESVPYIIVTRTGAPWGSSFEEMLAYATDHPGEVRYISRGPGAGPDLAMNNYSDIAGVSYNTSVGGSHAEMLTALGAGAGDIAVTLPGAASPFIQDGTVQLMTCTGDQNPCAANWGTEVPNAASVVGGIDNDPWGSNRGMVTAADVPESHRLWLEALVDAASDEQSFIDARSSIPGVGLSKRNKAEALDLQKTAYGIAYDILDKLGQLTPGAVAP
jgi:tripartite-type tricarboxylate transporter receptor subunit TctC